MLHLKRQKKSVAEYPGGIKIETGQIFGLPVDVLIPAAVTDSINDKNKNEIRAKIIVEGSNIPMRESLEEEFFKKGILVVPDFVANAGGVISSYAEYRGYSHEKMFKLVEKNKKCDNGRIETKLERKQKSPQSGNGNSGQTSGREKRKLLNCEIVFLFFLQRQRYQVLQKFFV